MTEEPFKIHRFSIERRKTTTNFHIEVKHPKQRETEPSDNIEFTALGERRKMKIKFKEKSRKLKDSTRTAIQTATFNSVTHATQWRVNLQSEKSTHK